MKTSKIFSDLKRTSSQLNATPNPDLKAPEIFPAVVGANQAGVQFIIRIPPYPGMAENDRVTLLIGGAETTPHVVTADEAGQVLQFVLPLDVLTDGDTLADGDAISVSYIVTSPAYDGGDNVSIAASIRVTGDVDATLTIADTDIRITDTGEVYSLDGRANYVILNLLDGVTTQDRVYLMITVNDGEWVAATRTSAPNLTTLASAAGSAAPQLRYVVPTDELVAKIGGAPIRNISVSFSLNTGPDDAARTPMFATPYVVTSTATSPLPAPAIDGVDLLHQAWKHIVATGAAAVPAHLGTHSRPYAVIPPYAGMSEQDLIILKMELTIATAVKPLGSVAFPVTSAHLGNPIVAPLYYVSDLVQQLTALHGGDTKTTLPVLVVSYSVYDSSGALLRASDRAYVRFS